MSLRHALLGLLAEGPASGFDLTGRFSEELAPIWPASHPHIYAELNRLERDGLIEVDSEGPRRRKAYRVTDPGLAEIRRWLIEEPVDHTMRLQPLLRSCFFWLMQPDDLRRHLEREHRFYAERAAGYAELAAAKERGEFGAGPRTEALRTTVDAGARLYQALADWATWALDHLPSDAQPDAPRAIPSKTMGIDNR